jgi:hypothetical protein
MKRPLRKEPRYEQLSAAYRETPLSVSGDLRGPWRPSVSLLSRANEDIGRIYQVHKVIEGLRVCALSLRPLP